MTQIIIVVGVPGCGKSTILHAVCSQCPEATIVNYGEAMLAEATRQHFDRDDLRKLPLIEQQRIGHKAAARIANEAKGVTLVDTHAMIRSGSAFCPGLPAPVLTALSPYAIALIEASPEIILKRRLADDSRSRDHESAAQIAQHQAVNHAAVVACSMHSGAFLTTLTNEGLSPKETAAPLIDLINQMSR